MSVCQVLRVWSICVLGWKLYEGMWGWTKLVESGSADDGTGSLIRYRWRESAVGWADLCWWYNLGVLAVMSDQTLGQ